MSYYQKKEEPVEDRWAEFRGRTYVQPGSYSIVAGVASAIILLAAAYFAMDSGKQANQLRVDSAPVRQLDDVKNERPLETPKTSGLLTNK